MSIRDNIAALRRTAADRGLTLGMAKLNDAIAKALYGRPYSPVIAAEAAGTPPELSATAERTAAVAAEYGLDGEIFAGIFVVASESKEETVEDGLTFSVDNLVRLNVDSLTDEDVHPAPLYCKYEMQYQAQPAYVQIDSSGNVTADYSGEISNAVPESVYHDRTLRFRVSPEVSGTSLFDYLLQFGRPLLARIHAGHEVDWNGSNQVGSLTDDAKEAVVEFQRMLSNLETTPVYTAAEWVRSYNRLTDIGSPSNTTFQQALADCMDGMDNGDGALESGSDEADIKEAILARALRCLDDGDAMPRYYARQLVIEGTRTLGDYAEWLVNSKADLTSVAEATADAALLPTVRLWIEDSKASTAEIEAGVSAAMAVLESRGVTAAQAELADWIETHSSEKIEEAHCNYAHHAAWLDAESAAFDVAFKGWAQRPEGACLTVA